MSIGLACTKLRAGSLGRLFSALRTGPSCGEVSQHGRLLVNFWLSARARATEHSPLGSLLVEDTATAHLATDRRALLEGDAQGAVTAGVVHDGADGGKAATSAASVAAAAVRLATGAGARGLVLLARHAGLSVKKEPILIRIRNLGMPAGTDGRSSWSRRRKLDERRWRVSLSRGEIFVESRLLESTRTLKRAAEAKGGAISKKKGGQER